MKLFRHALILLVASVHSIQLRCLDMVIRDPKVVILLATFNGAEFLPEQLRSYCDQTHSNWALLASDDGSGDGTLELIHEFSASVRQQVEIREGTKTAFWSNFLSLVLSGELDGDLFAYSDQDDVWANEKLSRAVAWFATIPDTIPALYFSRTELIGKDGRAIGFSPKFERHPTFRNALVQSIGGGNTMIFNRAARDILGQTTPDSTLVSHDWWTYQLVSGAGGFVHYDSWPSVGYRQHGDNLVGSNIGLRSRLKRMKAFADGRFVAWNDVNIAVLNDSRHLLTSDNAKSFDDFVASRQAALPKRLFLLWRSGVYRQGVLETIGMYIGALFGRM